MYRVLPFLLVISVLVGCRNEPLLCINGSYLNCICDTGGIGISLCLDGKEASPCECHPLQDLSPPPDLTTPPDLITQADMLDTGLRWVFVTSTLYQGDFSGYMSDADALCERRATDVGLDSADRVWVAWVTTAKGEPHDRLGVDGKPDPRRWRLVNHVNNKVPSILNASGIKKGEIHASRPIDVDERGNPLLSALIIWSPGSPNCNLWTTRQADGGTSDGPYANLNDQDLWRDGAQSCDQSAHILCLEK